MLKRLRFLQLMVGLCLLLFAVVVQPIFAQDTNASVINMWEGLNVRSAPDADASIIGELPGRTPVLILTRTRDNIWFQVQMPDGQLGWAAAGYFNLDVEIWQIPIEGASPSAESEAQPEESQPQEAITVPENFSADASVSASAYGGLNLRDAINGSRIGLLPAGTPLTILGESGGWLNVQTSNGQVGWVSARYVDRSSAGTTVTSNASAPSGPLPRGVAAIYQRGRQLGNNPNNFSRVGDSITASDLFLYPIGHGAYNLGAYGHLQDAISFFSSGDNSFLHQPIAANYGWTTADVLNPSLADANRCQAGESPLACEYRTVRPSVALIMFGSNDVALLSLDQYAANLDQIIQITIGQGIIPVLSTIPPRSGYNVGGINSVVRSTANRYGIPVWDYYGAMVGLPDSGLSADGIHPSAPDDGFGYAANFTEGFLHYGYVQRNLGALQMLYQLWRDVLAG
ncbi:MAG: SH3 domain-containing protein [Anaerolineae bacterium]|nr:SH3 domain-containing protein [Anaerolineae bacterium]